MVAGKAERCPPVEVPYPDVHASGASKDGGVAVSADIDDAHPPARAKDPDGFPESLGAFFAAVDVIEGQVAEHNVERIGRKREMPCIGIYEIDTFADPLGHRVTLSAGPGVPRLVTQTPDIGSGGTTSGEAVGGRDEDGAPAATDVEYVLVAPEIEFIEQLLPDRQFARTGAVEVARSESEHGDDPHLRHRAGQALVSSLRPPVTSQQTGSGQEEDRNAAVPSIDAVSGSISPHVTECASYRSRSSTTSGVVMMTARPDEARFREFMYSLVQRFSRPIHGSWHERTFLGERRCEIADR